MVTRLMRLDSLLSHITASLEHGDRTQQILATELLAYYPQAQTHLVELLSSKNHELVLCALHSLAKHKSCPIEAILTVLEHWQESDVILEVIETVSHNVNALRATDTLIHLSCDETQYWDGDWDDCADINLSAANTLLKIKAKLAPEQCQQLLNKANSDIEPDLKLKLLQLLAPYYPKDLASRVLSSHQSDTYLLLKATLNKAELYRATQESDVIAKQIGFARLADMEAREYLQAFLAVVCDSNPLIRNTAISALNRWNYKINVKYLTPIIESEQNTIDDLVPLLNDEGKLWLLDAWQQGELPNHTTPAIIGLSVNTRQSDEFLSEFYHRFPSLTDAQKIDSLNTLVQSSQTQLSLAFIRQTLNDEQANNTVKQLLISVLSKQSEKPFLLYFESLVFPQPIELSAQPDIGSHAENSVQNELNTSASVKSISAPNSTLASLLSPNIDAPTERRGKKKRKIANIQALETQAIAIEYCQDAFWLERLCYEKTLSEDCFSALITALMNTGVVFESITTSDFETQLLTTLKTSDSLPFETLLDWLNNGWLNRHMDDLIDSGNLTLIPRLLPFIDSQRTLLTLVEHPYIAIKQRAFEQLVVRQGADNIELFELVIGDSDLEPMMALFEPDTIEQAILAHFATFPTQALSLWAIHLETTRNTQQSRLRNLNVL